MKTVPPTATNRLLDAHLEKETVRFQEAIGNVKRLLTYGIGVRSEKPSDKAIREVTHKLLTVSSSTLFAACGSAQPTLDGFNPPHSPLGVLEFIHDFVEHFLLDDGTPGVGYCIYDPAALDCWRQAYPKEEGAIPYFHHEIERLQEFRETAEHLTADKVIEILDYHEGRHQTYIQWAKEEFDEEEQGELDPEADRLLRDLAEELLKP